MKSKVREFVVAIEIISLVHIPVNINEHVVDTELDEISATNYSVSIQIQRPLHLHTTPFICSYDT